MEFCENEFKLLDSFNKHSRTRCTKWCLMGITTICKKRKNVKVTLQATLRSIWKERHSRVFNHRKNDGRTGGSYQNYCCKLGGSKERIRELKWETSCLIMKLQQEGSKRNEERRKWIALEGCLKFNVDGAAQKNKLDQNRESIKRMPRGDCVIIFQTVGCKDSKEAEIPVIL